MIKFSIALLGGLLSSNAFGMCVLGVGADCPPTNEVAKAAFQQELEQMLAGTNVACSTTQFQKTNGMMDNMSGSYNYQFTAILNCHGPSFKLMYNTTDFVQGAIRATLWHLDGTEATVTVSYVLIFAKTDNGWTLIRAHG
jgi:hypothetical protein